MLRSSMIAVFAVIGVGAVSLSLLGFSPLTPGGLTLHACFDDVGGLETRDPVYLRGVEIGQVVSIAFDPDYRPCVELDVDVGLELADDTSAMILTRGILGDRAVDLQPGGSAGRLMDGDEIVYTQGALVLERMVGKILMELSPD